jgi:hypothetical protein
LACRSAPTSTFSATVMELNRFTSWNERDTPAAETRWLGRPSIRKSSSRTSPALGV